MIEFGSLEAARGGAAARVCFVRRERGEWLIAIRRIKTGLYIKYYNALCTCGRAVRAHALAHAINQTRVIHIH